MIRPGEPLALRALRALRIEIDTRRAEIDALQRAADFLERARRANDTTCDAGVAALCGGEVVACWCRRCGDVQRRCDRHGGIRAALRAAEEHGQKHAGPASGNRFLDAIGGAAYVTGRSR